MTKWQQREKYLLDIAARYLCGHKVFSLCRSHLVQASQISRGTIYNHFPHEADLLVALSLKQYQQWLSALIAEQQASADPFDCFIRHHCHRLYQQRAEQQFVIYRVMPNATVLAEASPEFRLRFEQCSARYYQLNKQLIEQMGVVDGYDRIQLVSDFIRGSFINADDAERGAHDISVYRQFMYALTQLLGQSDRHLPSEQQLRQYFKFLSTQAA